MANTNKPFGFAPVRTIGATTTGQVTRYYIPSTDNTAMYIGDVVISLAGGDANGVPGVAKATAGTEVPRGVIVGFEPANQNTVSLVGTSLALNQTSIPATKTQDYYAYVDDNPATVFSVQGDGTATNQVATNCNKNCSFTVAAGSTTVSASGSVITSSSINTTNSLNFKLMGLLQIPNNAFGAYAVWQGKWNLHELSAAGTTAI